MAELCDKKTESGKGLNSSEQCCLGNPERVQGFALNTLRGAAIALCITPEELKNLLGGTKCNNEEVSKLRLRVAELETENTELRSALNERLTETEKVFRNYMFFKYNIK
jgi:hypothetical protein